MAELNFFDTYFMRAVLEEQVPKATFFKDRYFPTNPGDIFSTDKVLTEYRKGDRKMAAFVSDRISDIPVERRGYEINEYTPPRISASRLLTIDDLKKRGFGEAIYATSTEAERAKRILAQDLKDLENRIIRREEWMCAQVMINNACDCVEYIDASTAGDTKHVQFYNTASSEHTYTVSTKWDATGGDFRGDVAAMCRLLSKRGLPAKDLILGSDAADAILGLQEVRDLLNRNLEISFGKVDQELTSYDGVVFMGALNLNGFWLNVFACDERYTADNGTDTAYFPAKGALVTAPGCGHLMYGSVTQIDHGATDFTTHVASRVPKLFVDGDNDVRKLRITSRPLAAPQNYTPYIYAANAVN